MFVPNLLVTDDDAAFRHVLCEGLARRGFHVSEARDGQEAMELIGRTKVHLVLVDVHMPRLSGLDVIRQLRDWPERPACVLMSARMDEAMRRQAIEMDAYDVLDKPIPLNRLNETIRNALAETYGWSDTE
jgi:two-component system chemotaxis response regulator CheY